MANHTTTQKLCNWFIQQANAKNLPLTPVKLNHLVILADWWHLHHHGDFLINERAEAWTCGPVLPSIHHEYKDQPPCSIIEHPSRRQPPLEEETDIIPFLEHIWNVYGKYTAQQLGRINTAPASPWQQAQGRHFFLPSSPALPPSRQIIFYRISYFSCSAKRKSNFS